MWNVTISTARKWNDQQKLTVTLFPDDEGNDGAQGFGLLELLILIARKILSQIIEMFLTPLPSFILQKPNIFLNIPYIDYLRLKVVRNWQWGNAQQKCNKF